jgi:hypothetical protein
MRSAFDCQALENADSDVDNGHGNRPLIGLHSLYAAYSEIFPWQKSMDVDPTKDSAGDFNRSLTREVPLQERKSADGDFKDASSATIDLHPFSK